MHLLRHKMKKILIVSLYMVVILLVIYMRKQEIYEFQEEHLVSMTNSALFYFGQRNITNKPLINLAL